jgi:hypothetical protein
LYASQFNTYYGAVDYSDQIVTAAFDGNAVTLNGKTFDFSSYGLEPRAGKNVLEFTVNPAKNGYSDIFFAVVFIKRSWRRHPHI